MGNAQKCHRRTQRPIRKPTDEQKKGPRVTKMELNRAMRARKEMFGIGSLCRRIFSLTITPPVGWTIPNTVPDCVGQAAKKPRYGGGDPVARYEFGHALRCGKFQTMTSSSIFTCRRGAGGPDRTVFVMTRLLNTS